MPNLGASKKLSREKNLTSAPPLELPCEVEQLTDLCRSLDIRFSFFEITKWFEPKELSYEKIRDTLERKLGDRYISDIITSLVLSVHRPKSANEVQELKKQTIERLSINIGAEQSKHCDLLYPAMSAQNFESRTTPMNTDLDRSPNLDFPIARFLRDRQSAEEVTVVDFGTGYPPVTTIETAKAFAGKAKIVGVDISIPDLIISFPCCDHYNYLVFYSFDPKSSKFEPITVLAELGSGRDMKHVYENVKGLEAEYALRKAEVVMQNLMGAKGRENYVALAKEAHALNSLPEAERQKSKILANIANKSKQLSIIQGRDSILVRPMQSYAENQTNLDFRRDDFRLATVEGVEIVRLGNVFLPGYYNKEEVHKALELITNKIKDGGVVVIATQDAHSFTLMKKDNKLLPLRSTVKLVNHYSFYVPEDLFPEFTHLFRLIATGIEVPQTERKSERMSIDSASNYKALFLKHGYKADIYSEANHTWCEIDMTSMPKQNLHKGSR